MSINEEVELLRAIPLFSKIDASKLKLLAFTSERLTYGDQQILFNQGDVGDSAHIIIDGGASVLIETDQGRIEVAKLGKGDVVGEIAILCDVPRTATIQAKGSLTTLKVSKETFFRLVTDFPLIAVEIMRELAARLERTNAQLRAAMSNQGS
ncbi:MAG: cyclic nucleotide-binding domain-containing protein [Planctomycetota bacterium]|jgi:CRP/FNR family cyclic AMP-dependent transcriptional regulator